MTLSPEARAAPQVLVVDDVPINRALLCLQLRKAGAVPHEAADGAAALALLQREPYQLVFMDVMMPMLDGYDACTAWRAWERVHGRAAVPVIGLTAGAPPDVHAQHDADAALPWRAAGMNAMLAKPLGAAAVAAVLRRWLNWP